VSELPKRFDVLAPLAVLCVLGTIPFNVCVLPHVVLNGRVGAVLHNLLIFTMPVAAILLGILHFIRDRMSELPLRGRRLAEVGVVGGVVWIVLLYWGLWVWASRGSP